MKNKILLSIILFLSFIKVFAGNENKDAKTSKSFGGCFGAHFNYYCPNADSIVGWDTIYISSNDTVFFSVSMDGFDGCPPSPYISRLYRNNVLIDSLFQNNNWLYYSVQQSGVYSGSGCATSSFSFISSQSTYTIINTSLTNSINETGNEYEFKTYISGNKIKVENFREKDFTFYLYDMAGRIIFQKKFANPSSSFEIELPTFLKGLYIINMRNNDFNFNRKINLSQ